MFSCLGFLVKGFRCFAEIKIAPEDILPQEEN